MAQNNNNQTTFNLPVVSNDPSDRLMQMIRQYDPHFMFNKLSIVTDFPVADDYELMIHYLRGQAGPIIDLLLYVDKGVGYSFQGHNFSNSEKTLQAIESVEETLKKMEFDETLDQYGVFYEALGRTCMVETFDLSGNYYFNPMMKCTGVDCINPMTLEPLSVRNVMIDTTGKENYVQNALTLDGKFEQIDFEPARVTYKTKNPMTKNSPFGNSDMQRCVTDLRAIARFPHFRQKLARKYSELFRVIQLDSEKIAGSGEAGRAITDDFSKAQTLLDDTAQFYRDQEDIGSTIAIYDWENVIDSSWAGKEVRMQDVEDATTKSIANAFRVPIALLDHRPDVNRDTLRTYLDTFITQREKGTRNNLYIPMIEKVANNILEQNGITDGYLTPKFNPFLSKNLTEMADIIAKIAPTGAITNPEIRDELDWPSDVNMGGDEWAVGNEKGINPIPKAAQQASPPTTTGAEPPYNTTPQQPPIPFTPQQKVIQDMIMKGLVRGM